MGRSSFGKVFLGARMLVVLSPGVTVTRAPHSDQSDDHAITIHLEGYSSGPTVDRVTISGSDATHENTGYRSTPALLLFSDCSESADLASTRAVETDYTRQVALTTADAYSDSYGLLFDSGQDDASCRASIP